MERLRWLPEVVNGASIIVNIPAFQLWAFDDVNDINSNMPNMRVVVGKALKNETPVLMAEMRFIDFMPYWNVPYNIVKTEILPKLLVSPGYLAKENMEIVAGSGAILPVNSASISLLKQGSARIRQKPGGKMPWAKSSLCSPIKRTCICTTRLRGHCSAGYAGILATVVCALPTRKGWQSLCCLASLSRMLSKKP